MLRSTICRLLSFPNRLPSWLLLVLIGVAIGYCVHIPHLTTQTNPPAVRPATETLEEFVAREAGRLLTADERTKLITVAEKILQQDFPRPSAMVEEFSFQRRLAGINSPAFHAFSDKWAAKVEETVDGGKTAAEAMEAMRSIYESLLRGLRETADSRRQTAAEEEEKEEGNMPEFDDETEQAEESAAVSQSTVQRPRFFLIFIITHTKP
jgi:hypothetical protein